MKPTIYPISKVVYATASLIAAPTPIPTHAIVSERIREDLSDSEIEECLKKGKELPPTHAPVRTPIVGAVTRHEGVRMMHLVQLYGMIQSGEIEVRSVASLTDPIRLGRELHINSEDDDLYGLTREGVEKLCASLSLDVEDVLGAVGESEEHQPERDAPGISYDRAEAALFEPIMVGALESLFPGLPWQSWHRKAEEYGLAVARQGRGLYNPYIAIYWVLQDRPWEATGSEEQLRQRLATRLPLESRQAFLKT